jgi:hypothetical protein
LQNVVVQQRVATVAVVVVVAALFALIVRPPIKEPAYSHELIAMQREVESFNVNFFGGGGGRVSFGELSEALEDQVRDAAVVDQKNQDRLAVLLDRYGWPTEKQVGREAVRAAITVVQRAPDVAFKERALGLIKAAGQDDTVDYARLVDQIAVAKGEPQTYGTSWTCVNGVARPATPVKDPERAIELRRQLGMDSYERAFWHGVLLPGVRRVERAGDVGTADRHQPRSPLGRDRHLAHFNDDLWLPFGVSDGCEVAAVR